MTREHRPVAPPAGPFVGIDYGLRRIGLALAASDGRFPVPATTLDATGQAARDAAAVLEWATERAPRTYVVGLPINMDGSEGPQARVTRAFADALAAQSGADVRLWDERLSSFQADQWLAEAPAAPRSRGKRAARHDPRRDALAALAILRAFLAAHGLPPTDDATPGDG